MREGEYGQLRHRYTRRTACGIHNRNGCYRAAAVFGVSKSTVHKDVSVRLKRQDPSLYREVRAVLEKNLLERHIRGGKATKLKYLAEKELTKSGN